MSRQIFVNLPVRDLGKATAFYVALGAERNPQFSDDTASCMAAGANGGKADVNPRQDHGFMYGRSFEDVDGHIWEVMYVDMSRMPKSG